MGTPLYEKHRPRSWDQVVGQDEAVRAVRTIMARDGLGGKALWVSGPSGVGKSTIGKLIAAEVADEFFTHELDAQDATAAALRELEQSLRMTAWGKGGRAVLIHEAHGLRQDAIKHLLVMLERLPGHVVVVFTTTTAGEATLIGRAVDWHPLLSRCIDLRLEFEPPGVAEHVKRIAEAEGLGGASLAEYQGLAERCRFNIRAMLQAVEAGRMMREREGPARLRPAPATNGSVRYV